MCILPLVSKITTLFEQIVSWILAFGLDNYAALCSTKQKRHEKLRVFHDLYRCAGLRREVSLNRETRASWRTVSIEESVDLLF